LGTDSSVIVPPQFYEIDSEANVFEMAEVYAMSITRDIPFRLFKDGIQDDLSGDDLAKYNLLQEYSNVLNNFSDKTSAPTNEDGLIRPGNLFRGAGIGETIGPYVSQFLIQPFNYGNIEIEQKFLSEPDDKMSTHMTNYINVQNGHLPDPLEQSAAQFCFSPRILGAKVHNDPLYQFYYNAALIMLSNKIASPSGFANSKSSAWTSGGGPNVLASVAHVCQGALRMAWHSKYGVGMKIRPEVMAQRINLAVTDDSGTYTQAVPGLDNIRECITEKAQTILDAVQTHNGTENPGGDTYLLMLQFPEGSPVHPSWPAGHATVAGAGVTVLKAMFACHDENNEAKPWPAFVPPLESIDGSNADQLAGGVPPGMTIISELNKLASNVSLGRDWAGVHYRCDGDCGVLAGEEYAITYLQDVAKEYHESKNGLFEGFLLEKFNGDKIMIKANSVTNIE